MAQPFYLEEEAPCINLLRTPQGYAASKVARRNSASMPHLDKITDDINEK
jgi:hypothetical protein